MGDYSEDVMQMSREAAAAYWQTVPASSWSMPVAALDGALDTEAQILIAARALKANGRDL